MEASERGRNSRSAEGSRAILRSAEGSRAILLALGPGRANRPSSRHMAPRAGPSDVGPERAYPAPAAAA